MASAGSTGPAVDKTLIASIVQYLHAVGPDVGTEAVALADALAGAVSLTDADFDTAATHTPLNEAFEAGRGDGVAKPELFEKYITSLRGRGYFGEAAAASPGAHVRLVVAFCACHSLTGLTCLLAEYVGKFKAALDRFRQRMASGETGKAPQPTVQDEEAAEKAKAEGNAALQEGRTQDAIACYTKALELAPQGASAHTYLCNRAAAHLKLHEYSKAAADADAAIALSPQYVKAHNRLGTARFHLGQYEGAVQAFEAALELEPSNAAALQGKESAASKLQQVAPPTPPPVAPGGMGGGLPAGFPGMGAGGMPDLGALLSNPAVGQMMQSPQFQQMAQNLMSNPAAMQQMASMMGGMMGGGGGNGGGMDPAALAQMASMMGGGGGAPPSGDTPPSE